MRKEAVPKRSRPRKKTITWVAGVVSTVSGLAPYIADIIKAFRKP